MSSFLSSRAIVGAAIFGLVGAAGMFLYEQIYAEKRRAMLVRDMARLDEKVAIMNDELEKLRELQKESHAKSQKPRHRRPKPVNGFKKKNGSLPKTPDRIDGDMSVAPTSDTDYTTEYASAVGTDYDVSSEEFYDVPTDSDEDSDLVNGSDDTSSLAAEIRAMKRRIQLIPDITVNQPSG